jgi:pSer/pThr/pTyr-binding forkhead associated (FHA) protein
MDEVTLQIKSIEGESLVPLAEGSLTIGRGESATVRLDDASLSRVHASFHREGERLWVLDEGSSNGTFLNGRRLDASGAALSRGDKVRLGDRTIVTVGLSRASKETGETGETGLSRWQIVAAAGLVLLFLSGMMFLLLHFKGKREGLPARGEEQVDASTPAIADTTSPTPSPTSILVDPTDAAAVVPGAPILYIQMDASQKFDFLDRRARHITQMMGNREYVFDREVLGYIKEYLDGYSRRVGTGSSAMWGEDLRFLFGRGVRLAPTIIAAFKREGVPPVVGLYIPVIESEYRECLESPVGAKGLFQFMAATAEGYGVPASERCNVERMAPAAARYMKDRISEFGTGAMSVALGIAAYNRSPDSVRRDLQTVIDSQTNERSFWTLLARRTELDHFFQKENVKYVPKFFAAAIVGETPSAFGLSMQRLSTY